jgi:Fur family ferric uptake transcriptional regulator
VHISAEALLSSLRRSGLRITDARRAVCQVLAESHDDHLSAADLHRRVEESTGASVDPSTIYRTIDALEQAGHLQHVHFGHGPGVVHLIEGQHHHVVCDNCGRTVDLALDELEALTDLLDRHDYTLGSVHFAIVAHCRSCS